jgi:hypothetical protein
MQTGTSYREASLGTKTSPVAIPCVYAEGCGLHSGVVTMHSPARIEAQQALIALSDRLWR